MKDLLDELERMMPAGVALLERVVNLDSPTYDGALVDRVGQVVAAEFEKLGGAVVRTPEPERGDHLTIRLPGRAGPAVMLLGHLDTVWSAGEVARRPFRIDGGLASGPGIFDMKAGVVMMWMALAALIRLRGGLPLPVKVLLTSNEEAGSPGSRAIVRREAEGMRAVLVLEPPLPGGVLKTVRNGVGRFTITVRGRATHSGINPGEGVNAIEEMAHHVLRLQRLGDLARRTTVSVGVIQGGTRPNVVPAECVIEVDSRTATSEEAERITREVRSLKPVLPGADIQVEGAFRRPPMERTPANMELFGMAREIAAALGRDLAEGATGGASDGNLTSGMGIATLDGLGPVGMGAHQVDEYVELESIPWRTALVAGLLERLAP